MIRRHLYTEVRITWLATLARRLALFALPVIVLSIGLHRLGLVEYEVAYVTLTAGIAVAALAALVAVAAFVVIWNEGLRGLGRAIAAFLIGIAVLAWPMFEVVRSSTLPAIADVTSDPSDPPRFVAVASARRWPTREPMVIPRTGSRTPKKLLLPPTTFPLSGLIPEP